MKKLILLAACSLCIVAFSHAQRYAVIDTKYILDKMPEYKTAQKTLDDVAAGWQKEIDGMQQELDKMYKDFDAEQVMLSEELKKKKRCATCSASALVLKATCLRKGRSSSNPYRTRFITLCKNWPYKEDMT